MRYALEHNIQEVVAVRFPWASRRHPNPNMAERRFFSPKDANKERFGLSGENWPVEDPDRYQLIELTEKQIVSLKDCVSSVIRKLNWAIRNDPSSHPGGVAVEIGTAATKVSRLGSESDRRTLSTTLRRDRRELIDEVTRPPIVAASHLPPVVVERSRRSMDSEQWAATKTLIAEQRKRVGFELAKISPLVEPYDAETFMERLGGGSLEMTQDKIVAQLRH